MTSSGFAEQERALRPETANSQPAPFFFSQVDPLLKAVLLLLSQFSSDAGGGSGVVAERRFGGPLARLSTRLAPLTDSGRLPVALCVLKNKVVLAPQKQNRIEV